MRSAKSGRRREKSILRTRGRSQRLQRMGALLKRDDQASAFRQVRGIDALNHFQREPVVRATRQRRAVVLDGVQQILDQDLIRAGQVTGRRPWLVVGEEVTRSSFRS